MTLTNRSSGPLAVETVAVAGADSSSFRVPPAHDECSGQTIPGGGTCKVKAVFRPDGVGPKTARLEFSDDAVTSPQIVGLDGFGTPGPWVTRSVQTLKFGHNPVGTRPRPKQVVLTNTGSAAGRDHLDRPRRRGSGRLRRPRRELHRARKSRPRRELQRRDRIPPLGHRHATGPPGDRGRLPAGRRARPAARNRDLSGCESGDRHVRFSGSREH